SGDEQRSSRSTANALGSTTTSGHASRPEAMAASSAASSQLAVTARLSHTAARMACPDPDLLGTFVDGTIAADVRATIEAHVDECDECRRTIALLARTRAAEWPSSRAALTDTEPDTEPSSPSPR